MCHWPQAQRLPVDEKEHELAQRADAQQDAGEASADPQPGEGRVHPPVGEIRLCQNEIHDTQREIEHGQDRQQAGRPGIPHEAALGQGCFEAQIHVDHGKAAARRGVHGGDDLTLQQRPLALIVQVRDAVYYCLAGANGYNGMWQYVDAFRYAYEYINVWDEANIEAMASSSGSGEPSMGSGEPS